MVKGVIFDMDGLMFDTERLWDTLWEPACAALGLPLPADMEKFKAGGRPAPPCGRVHPRRPAEGAGQDLAAGGRALCPGRTLQKGSEGAAGRVGGHGPAAHCGKLEPAEYDRDEFADHRHGEVAHSKPAPDTFLVAAKKLHLDPHDCLVLEDSFNGVRAGRAAGCVTVMVPDLMQPTEEIAQLYDRKCEDLLEVRDLLIEGKL